MAKFSFGAIQRAFGEGSLVKRTLVHVGALVAGSALFVATTSLVLVGVAKSVVPTRAEKTGDAAAETSKPKSARGAKADEPSAEKVSARPGAGADDEE